ncbi:MULTISPECIES: SprT family protein [Paenibacillus]|uniref:SprT family protein n=1 Tax=Paenibacillus radicis (ex Xue et al. 2023) TaxID=2972489 RepID=A0ABT1YS51_9BACL|nr:SprT family protein [Paenibacillus radicis (ex Xue et al. 2023)]MCR8636006.1 SprT family protein [Paenibacillus radicis (ex Xue et al. 2023)]
MKDEQLQEWVERVSITSFGRPFVHQARFNRRLTSTGGRYFTKSHDIEISWQQYEQFGADDVEKIIKHELCHYHLHILKRGYQHRDAEFKSLLQQVGGTRFCKSLPTAKRREPYRYKLVCTSCPTEYLRKRKMDPRKYACGNCRGKLKLLKLDLKEHS